MRLKIIVQDLLLTKQKKVVLAIQADQTAREVVNQIRKTLDIKQKVKMVTEDGFEILNQSVVSQVLDSDMVVRIESEE